MHAPGKQPLACGIDDGPSESVIVNEMKLALQAVYS